VYLMAGAIYMLAEVDALEREGNRHQYKQEHSHPATEPAPTGPAPSLRPRRR
jgi:hypothetical protein